MMKRPEPWPKWAANLWIVFCLSLIVSCLWLTFCAPAHAETSIVRLAADPPAPPSEICPNGSGAYVVDDGQTSDLPGCRWCIRVHPEAVPPIPSNAVISFVTCYWTGAVVGGRDDISRVEALRAQGMFKVYCGGLPIVPGVTEVSFAASDCPPWSPADFSPSGTATVKMIVAAQGKCDTRPPRVLRTDGVWYAVEWSVP